MKAKMLLQIAVAQATLLGLKLLKAVDWSWWVILLPVIVPSGLFLAFIICLIFIQNSNFDQ